MKKKIIISVLALLLIGVFALVICYQQHSINNLNKEVNLRGRKIQEYEAKETDSPKKTHTNKNKDTSSSDADKIDKLNEEISELEEENSKLEEKVSDLETRKKVLEKKYSILEHENETLNEDTTSTFNYLKVKFWYDGKNYEITNEGMKLYKNPYLSKEMRGKVIVVSPTISEDHLENGQTVFTVMSNQGLAFMSSYPSFNEIEGNLTAPESAFSQDETEKYLAIKFWQNGTYDKTLYPDSNQHWYSDCYLSEKVKDSSSVVIVSENTDNFKLENNITVYSAQTENGNIVWMSENPELETIQ